jgi:hypothetical protein
VNLDEVKSSKPRDYQSTFKASASESAHPESQPKTTSPNILELDLLGGDDTTTPKTTQNLTQGHSSGLADLDILGLDQISQPKATVGGSQAGGMLDLLGGGELLSMDNPKGGSSYPQTQGGFGHGAIINPLDTFNLGNMGSAAAGHGQTHASPSLSSDPLDLLGGMGVPSMGHSQSQPIQNHQKPQTSPMNLLDDDLLGGGLSSGPSNSLEFLGYEDSSLSIKFKCAKVAGF